MFAWPSNSWTALKSWLDCNKCDAKLCLRRWGWIFSGIPCLIAQNFSLYWIALGVNFLAFWLKKIILFSDVRLLIFFLNSSHFFIASEACEPTGTILSLLPLPKIEIVPSSRLISFWFRFTSSDNRSPDE